METHLKPKARTLFDDVDDKGRVVALCGVKVSLDAIVETKPSCSWCERKQAEGK